MQFLLGLPHSLSFSSASLFPACAQLFFFFCTALPGLPRGIAYALSGAQDRLAILLQTVYNTIGKKRQ